MQENQPHSGDHNIRLTPVYSNTEIDARGRKHPLGGPRASHISPSNHRPIRYPSSKTYQSRHLPLHDHNNPWSAAASAKFLRVAQAPRWSKSEPVSR